MPANFNKLKGSSALWTDVSLIVLSVPVGLIKTAKMAPAAFLPLAAVLLKQQVELKLTNILVDP